MDLQSFLRPLYQDLDGASRQEEVDRIAKIARRLYSPATAADARAFELLLVFHPLGKWLDKVGNLSRTLLAVDGVNEAELRQTAASIRRLEDPTTEPERAVAAAVLIDDAGVRGLTDRLLHARREGSNALDVVRAVMADVDEPDWLPANARPWLHARRESRREVCRRLFEELAGEDLERP